jgi:hypothetical protein
MYVCTRVVQRLALAPRPLMIYEDTHRLKRYTVLLCKTDLRKTQIQELKWCLSEQKKSIWVTPVGIIHSRASTCWTYKFICRFYRLCIINCEIIKYKYFPLNDLREFSTKCVAMRLRDGHRCACLYVALTYFNAAYALCTVRVRIAISHFNIADSIVIRKSEKKH